MREFDAEPLRGREITRKRASPAISARQISSVPSVDSSTTRSASKSGSVWFRIEAIISFA